MAEEEQQSITQTELDRFRQAWLSEVERNNRRSEPDQLKEDANRNRLSAGAPAATSSRAPVSSSRQKYDFSEDVEPRAYHDLPNDEERLTLGESGQEKNRGSIKEPSSALEHYEVRLKLPNPPARTLDNPLKAKRAEENTDIFRSTQSKRKREDSWETQFNTIVKHSKFVALFIRSIIVHALR